VSEIKTPFCNRSMRPSLDDFPLTQHLALAAMGGMSSEATHPSVTTAEMTGDVRVAINHINRNRRWWSKRRSEVGSHPAIAADNPAFRARQGQPPRPS
jgi:hypothetical protein